MGDSPHAEKGSAQSAYHSSVDVQPGSQPSSGLQSAEKPMTVQPGKESTYVLVQETLDGFEVKLSPDRPATNQKSGQGDHITAYVAYLQLIVSASDWSDIRTTANTIARVGMALLPGLSRQLRSKLEEREAKLAALPDLALRTRAYRVLRSSDEFTPEQLKQLKLALVSNRHAVYCESAAAVANTCLSVLNSAEHAVLVRAPKKPDAPEGSSSNTTSGSELRGMGQLRVLNRLCLEKPEDVGEIDWVDDFYRRYLVTGAPYVRGMNALWRDGKRLLWAQEIQRKLRESSTWQPSCEGSDKQMLSRDFLSHFDNGEVKAEAIRPLQAWAKRDIQDSDKLAGLFFDLMDFPYDDRTDRLKPDEVGKIIAFHLLVMFHSFSGITEHCDRGKVVRLFAEQVHVAQGGKGRWCEAKRFQDKQMWLERVEQAADFSTLTMRKAQQEAAATSQTPRGFGYDGGGALAPQDAGDDAAVDDDAVDDDAVDDDAVLGSKRTLRGAKK